MKILRSLFIPLSIILLISCTINLKKFSASDISSSSSSSSSSKDSTLYLIATTAEISEVRKDAVRKIPLDQALLK